MANTILHEAIGVVSATKGEVFAKGADGQMRRLAVGDTIYEGDVIVTANGSTAEIAPFNGPVIEVQEQQTFAVDGQAAAPAAGQDATTGAVEPLGPTEAAKVIQTVGAPEAGANFNAALEEDATAAGLTGGDAAQGGHSFVDLMRIVETVPGVGYEFPTNPFGTAPTLVGQEVVPTAVTIANSAPVANPDMYETREDTPLTINPAGVLSNDSDVDGDTLTVTSYTQPANGTVAIDADGKLVYTPNENFHGTETLSYTVSDGNGGTASAEVTINVTPVNDPPTVDVMAATTFTEGGAQAGDVAFTYTGSDPDTPADQLIYTLTNDSNGYLAMGSEPGTIVLTEKGAAAINADMPISSLTAAVEVSDGQLTASDSADTTVTPVNDPPTSTNDSVSTFEDTAKVLSLSDFGTYGDVENNALAAIKITTLPADGTLQYHGDNGWVAVTLNQEISVAAIEAGGLRFVPDVNESGDSYATIGFKVGDGSDFSTASYNLNVDVTPVADAPQLIVSVGAPTTIPGTSILPDLNHSDGIVFAYADNAAIDFNHLANTGAQLNYAGGNGYGIETTGESTSGGAKVVDQGETMVIAVPDAAKGNEITVWLKHVDNESVTLRAYDADGTLLNGGQVVYATNNADVQATLQFTGDVAYVTVTADTYNDPHGGKAGFNIMDVQLGYSPDTYVYQLDVQQALTDTDGSESLNASFTLDQSTLPSGVTFDSTSNLLVSNHQLSGDEINGITTSLTSTESANLDSATTIATVRYEFAGTDASAQTQDVLLTGTSNADVLKGGSGEDILIGGSGGDTMSGGLGSDAFVWRLADLGTSSTPAHDVVTDFNAGQGDVINLADVLSSGANTLSAIADSSGHLVLQVTSGGAVVQDIALQTVAVTDNSAATNMLNSMIQNGHIITNG